MPVSRSTNLSHPQRNAPRMKLDYDVPYFRSVDTTSDAEEMDELDSPDALNIIYDTDFSVLSRKGYTKLLTTSLTNFIGGMYAFYKSDGTKQLVYGSGTGLYKYDNAGGSTVLSGVPATFTANQQWSFDELLDNIYACNGVDGLFKYNGTAYTQIVPTAPPAGLTFTPQFMKIHKNRAYLANRNSSILYFSDSGNLDSYPVNNFIQINTNDGQNITGISEILDNLIIFKDESVWILTGEPLGAGNSTTIGNLQLRQANSPVGCSAFRTICKVEQTIYFMHHTGLYALQNYSVQPISKKLLQTFKTGTNPGFLNLSWGIYNSLEQKYIVGYPSPASATPDVAIMYDIGEHQYALWDHVPGMCAVNYRFSGLLDTTLIGDPTKGNIYQMFQGSADIYGDNGTATGGTTTTLTDASKNWPVNGLVDARIKITANSGAGTVAVITANTATTVTFAVVSSAPAAGSTYTIGYYDSYWTTKNFDFGMTGYTKKYRFFNLFIDAQLYPIKFGYSVDFQPLAYQKALNITSGAQVWGSGTWGVGNWGSYSSLFAQANIGSTGRYIRFKFGNDLANQPWRAIKYSISYKLKKERPNIVTT